MQKVIVVLSFVLSTSLSIDTVTDFQLKFLTAVFRHGDRAPLFTVDEGYPNDPYLDNDFYPEGPSQLTNSGKRREYELGQAIRKKYDAFLGAVYKSRDIFARSTATDRTRMSLQLVLAGLYPPVGEQRWSDLDWQPTRTAEVQWADDVLMVPEECPQFMAEKRRVQSMPNYIAKLLPFSDLMRSLTDITGKVISTAEDMYLLWHTLMAETAEGLGLPSWTKDLFPYGRLYDGALLEYELRNYNEKLTRMNGGMLVQNITLSMLEVVSGVNSKKLQLLSGHESNVDGMLRAFAVNKPHAPAYSSAVLVELLQGGTEYYVRVVHYLGIPEEFEEKVIPGCDSPCPLSDFLRLMKYSMPHEQEKICIREARDKDDTDWTQVTSIADLVKRRLNHV